MKNRFTLFLSLTLVCFVAIGCGLGGLTGGSDTDSTKDSPGTSSDSKRRKEVAPSGDVVKVGIPECDEFATYLNDNAKEIEADSIVVRGLVQFYKQTILSNLRETVEKMDDKQKAKTGENCKKALEELKKSMKK